MELELDLAPDDAARLPRLALLAPMKSGRARTRPVRIVWHDSPDHALAADGLALAEQRPFWRLERLAMQPLGAPAEVLATDRTTAALGHALPDPRVPLVAFEGRAQTLTLAGEQGAIVLTLLNGVVRTLASEHRISRVRLEGAAAAVQSLATAIAGELRLTVACTSLAAEALAVVTGRAATTSHRTRRVADGIGDSRGVRACRRPSGRRHSALRAGSRRWPGRTRASASDARRGATAALGHQGIRPGVELSDCRCRRRRASRHWPPGWRRRAIGMSSSPRRPSRSPRRFPMRSGCNGCWPQPNGVGAATMRRCALTSAAVSSVALGSHSPVLPPARIGMRNWTKPNRPNSPSRWTISPRAS